MPLNDRLRGVIDWLVAGYPSGIPAKDYIPVLALLRRRLTQDEVATVALAIATRYPSGSATDIAVGISKITDELPSEDDVARVETHLTQHHGWPDVTLS